LRLPECVGPGEEAREFDIDAWLAKMLRWHLLTRDWAIRNGTGGWEYYNTTLGNLLFRLLELLTKLRILRSEP
jgi:hypothetical protein